MRLQALNRYSGSGHEYEFVDGEWQPLPGHGLGCWTDSLNEVVIWARAHAAPQFEIEIEAELSIPMIEKRLGETWLRNLLRPGEPIDPPELDDFGCDGTDR